MLRQCCFFPGHIYIRLSQRKTCANGSVAAVSSHELVFPEPQPATEPIHMYSLYSGSLGACAWLALRIMVLRHDPQPIFCFLHISEPRLVLLACHRVILLSSRMSSTTKLRSRNGSTVCFAIHKLDDALPNNDPARR